MLKPQLHQYFRMCVGEGPAHIIKLAVAIAPQFMVLYVLHDPVIQVCCSVDTLSAGQNGILWLGLSENVQNIECV